MCLSKRFEEQNSSPGYMPSCTFGTPGLFFVIHLLLSQLIYLPSGERHWVFLSKRRFFLGVFILSSTA